jgi:hypothetical protein
MPPKECPICIEKFNKVNRKEIQCSSCQHTCCRSCVEAYILSITAEPCCLNCKKEWSMEFIRDNMTKTFCDTKLKEHRENILYDREKSLLPATQGYIQMLKEKNRISERISQIWKLRSELDKQIENEKERLRNIEKTDADVSKTKFVRACPMPDCRGFLSTSYKCGTCNVWACPDCKEIKGFAKDTAHTCDPEILKSVKAIESETKPCPNCAVPIHKIDGCFKGDTPFVSYTSNDKPKLAKDIKVGDVLYGHDGKPRTVISTMSGIDEMYKVSQSSGMDYIVNSKHKLVLVDTYCDAPLLLNPVEYLALPEEERVFLRGIKYGAEYHTKITVEPIGQDTYYGFMVSDNPLILLEDFTVVHNCNQFFCTACNTVFDWKTGKITVGGPIHNPHYFEWIRNNGGNVRQIGDAPCGGLPYAFRYTKAIECYKEHYDYLIHIYRITAEINDYWVGRYPVTSSLHGNRDLRANFLMNYITEEEFKRQLQIREKKIQKNTAIRQVLDTFNTVATENVIAIFEYSATKRNISNVLEQIEKVREYTNTCLLNVGKKFNCTVPQIQPDWKRVITK